MKKAIIILLIVFPFLLNAQKQLVIELQVSLSLTKKNPKEGLKACLYAFQHHANSSLSTENFSLRSGFRGLEIIFDKLNEEFYEEIKPIGPLLLQHYYSCIKTAPLQAIQFALLYDRFSPDGLASARKGNSYEKFIEEFLKMLRENGFLMLYHYYSSDGYYAYDPDRNVGASYELLSEYGWVEQSQFYENNLDEVSVWELNPTLAEYTHREYVDDFVYRVEGEPECINRLATKDSWDINDVLIAWYCMMDNYERGSFENAIYFGELAKKAKITGKAKYYYMDLLTDYSTVCANVFSKHQTKTVETSLLPKRLTKRYAFYVEFSNLADKMINGLINKSDIDKVALLLEEERKKEKATDENYISDFWYEFDLGLATLYKQFGYKENALFYLNRLKTLSQLTIRDIQRYKFGIEEFIAVHLNLAQLYHGLVDKTSFEKEKRIVENTLNLFKNLKSFHEDGKANFISLTEEIKSINQNINQSSQNNSAIDSLMFIVSDPNNNSFCEASVLLPLQFNDSVFVPAMRLREWVAIMPADKSYPAHMDKYSTLGYPLVYGLNKEGLFFLYESYYDFLDNVNMVGDFEPWFNATMTLHEQIRYSRPMSFQEFTNDFFIGKLFNDKYYLDKADRIYNKWLQHCSIRKDTNSMIYASALSGKTYVMNEEKNLQEKLANNLIYFNLVKARGDCSQCYFASSLQVAESYIKLIDTTNARLVLYDLIRKSRGENVPKDLQSSTWQKYLELLSTRLYLENDQERKNELLSRVNQAVGYAKGLWAEDRSTFDHYQKWAEIENNRLTESAAIDSVWNAYLKSHHSFIRNQAYYTDRDRVVYFEDHLLTQDILAWRYSLTASTDSSRSADLFTYSIFYKSLSTGTNAQIKKYIQQRNNPDLTAKWEELLTMRSASFANQTKNEYKEYQLEKDLLLAMITDSVSVSNEPVDIKTMQAQLDDKSYIVNIIRAKNDLTGKLIYFAQVLSKKNNTPKYVFLGDGNFLEVDAWKHYEKNIKQPDNTVKDTSSFTAFWKKLNHLIPTGSRVYILNDGVYHKINLASIFNPVSKKYLTDEFQFRYVSDISSIGKPSGSFGVNINADIFGNPAFQLGYFKQDVVINELTNTDSECESIYQILATANNNETLPVLFKGNEASEEHLKAIHAPTILHIASHGFFVPTHEEKESIARQKVFTGDVTFRSATIDFTTTTDPLLRSGILLSGCSNTLNGQAIGYGRSEDGILTAKEVMQVNLEGTKLVVMSACETGLGDIVPGQGIAGLQKGFKTAGAENLVLTLWSVDDYATREFMELLYHELARNKNDENCVEKSFFTAQTTFKNNPKFQHPFFWGAFVLVK